MMARGARLSAVLLLSLQRVSLASGAETTENENAACKLRGCGGVLGSSDAPAAAQQADLKACLAGRGLSALYPGDTGFNQSAQIHNYRVSYLVQPNATVWVNCTEDVMAAVLCAQAALLPALATSGMNAYEAFCTHGCLLILTEGIKRIEVDATTRTAILGPGLTNGEMYYHLAYAQGGPFALPSGTINIVGLGGIALGGGKGYVTRYAGLLIDNLFGVDLILWNGTLVHASQEENPDLLWLCRGGGGMQIPGVVVAFYFNLIDAPSAVCNFKISYSIADGEKVVAAWQSDLVTHSDERLHVRLEPNSFGNRQVSLTGFYVDGTCEEAREVMQPTLAGLPEPITNLDDPDTFLSMSWLDTVKSTSGFCEYCNGQGAGECLPDEVLIDPVEYDPNYCGYGRSFVSPIKHRALVFEKPLDEQGIKEFVKWFSDPPFGGNNAPGNPYSGFYLQVDPTNGKAAQMPSNATAYHWRSAEGMTLQLVITFPDNTRSNQTWEDFSYDFIQALQPWAAGGRSYINYLDKDLPGIPALEAYWGEEHDRLVATMDSFTTGSDQISHCYWTTTPGCTF